MEKQKKKVEINRSKYNQIRKMDHNTMEQYITGHYERGYEDGYAAGQQAAAPAFNTFKALERIMRIKGIGRARLEEIRRAMVAAGATEVPEEQLAAIEAQMKRMAAGSQKA